MSQGGMRIDRASLGLHPAQDQGARRRERHRTQLQAEAHAPSAAQSDEAS
jgi:hypothetical protein